MKKITKLEDIPGIKQDWAVELGTLTYATADNTIVLADTLDSVVNKLNELIDQVNYLSDQLKERE